MLQSDLHLRAVGILISGIAREEIKTVSAYIMAILKKSKVPRTEGVGYTGLDVFRITVGYAV